MLAGCTSTITNLTPSQYPREATGFYRVEAMWKTSRSVVKPDTFKPAVVLNFTNYPMRPVPMVQDRWEAYIPIPADTNFVTYHYKFDFLDYAFGKPKPDSMMSGTCELSIK